MAGIYEMQLNSVLRLRAHNISCICTCFRFLHICNKSETLVFKHSYKMIDLLEVINMLLLLSMVILPGFRVCV